MSLTFDKLKSVEVTGHWSYGQKEDGESEWCFAEDGPEGLAYEDEIYKITFLTCEGVPICETVKMEKV
jgi:hypothetical protein